MSCSEACQAMTELEKIDCEIDYKKGDLYKEKVRQHFRRMTQQYPNQPALFDVSMGRTTLPTDLDARVEEWVLSNPCYSRWVKRFAKSYLISILDSHCDSSVYRPRAECVIGGADSYIECGLLYLDDLGGIPANYAL